MVNACAVLGVEVIKCNAQRLNSASLRLGIDDTDKTCKNRQAGKLINRLSTCVGVFSQSAVNNHQLENFREVLEEFVRMYNDIVSTEYIQGAHGRVLA